MLGCLLFFLQVLEYSVASFREIVISQQIRDIEESRI